MELKNHLHTNLDQLFIRTSIIFGSDTNGEDIEGYTGVKRNMTAITIDWN
ncbi:hypothetical protein HanPI659440_Chr08g0288221 [Helianthus annuus]|nr:hypothetical protein HanPI659440_Chr08g0288221 [Helianthus annuus]